MASWLLSATLTTQVEDPDRRAQAEGLRALATADEAARRAVHQQPDPAVIGGGQGSLGKLSAPRSSSCSYRPQPRSRRHAPDLASGPQARAQAIPAPVVTPATQLSLLDAPTHRRRHPARALVAGGYGGIFVLLTPTGAMLVALVTSRTKLARAVESPKSSIGHLGVQDCFRKKPS